MNPYDPTTAAHDLAANSNCRPTPATAWAIALTPIVWAIVFLFLINAGIKDICDRHPRAGDMPIGYTLFAFAALLAFTPVNYMVAATLFRPIVRSRCMRFRFELIAMLCVAGLIASLLAPLAVAQVPGLTPLQQDRDALTRPFVVASLISALTFFGLTRDCVLSIPSKLLRASIRLWPKRA